jgi:hypothetical protein
MNPVPTLEDGYLQECLEELLPDPDLYQIQLKDRLKISVKRGDAVPPAIQSTVLAWAQNILANHGPSYCKTRLDDLVVDLWDQWVAERSWRKIWAKHKIRFNDMLKSPTFHLAREKAARKGVYQAMQASKKQMNEHYQVWLEIYDRALALTAVLDSATVTRV